MLVEHLHKPEIKRRWSLSGLHEKQTHKQEQKKSFCFHLKEFRSEDVGDLYLEEREKQLQAAQEEKRKVQLSVPGMVNPHDMPEEMQD